MMMDCCLLMTLLHYTNETGIMGAQDKPQASAMASGTPCTSGCSGALATHWEALLLAVFETFLQ